MKLIAAIFNLIGLSPVLATPKNIAEKDVWSYPTRSGESSSTLTILKIEKINGIEVVHIRIDGLKIKNNHRPTGFSEEIAHMPFDKDSLSKNLTKKIKTVSALPDFSEGYNQWKNDAKAGVFNIPVKDAVSFAEQTLNQK